MATTSLSPASAQMAAPMDQPTAPAAAPVTGEAPTSSGMAELRRYIPADFARYAPRTALDMLVQVPGFTIQQISTGGGRGLGGARENVLINGERIAAKSSDASTILSQINAASVERIEILDGATLNIPGLNGQVANVVVKQTNIETTFQWTPQFRHRIADNIASGQISVSGQMAGGDFSFSLANTNGFRRGDWGTKTTYDPSGVMLFVRDEYAHYDQDSPTLSGNFSRKAANGNLLNINASLTRERQKTGLIATSVQPGAGAVTEVFKTGYREWSGELGGDYEFAAGDGRFKLIALQNFFHVPADISTGLYDSALNGRRGTRFTEASTSAESILRSEYSWKAMGGDWQVALEGAYNRLDVDAELARLQNDGSYLPVVFGGERTQVREKRADLSLTHSRDLASNLSMQLTLGGEYSQISLLGPHGRSRTFLRPKGRAAFSWKADPKTTINLELLRQVNQLDFFDFAASVDLENDTGNNTNASLVPPQMWRGEVQVVRDLGKWGNITVAGAIAHVDDILDQIPLSPTTEGRGNLPYADLARISSKATILFDPIGWKGARFNFDVLFRKSRVRDPLLGTPRQISEEQLHTIDMTLRYDVPNTDWAFGTNLTHNLSAAWYRLDEVSHATQDKPFLLYFVEHKNLLGLTARFSAMNLLSTHNQFWRDSYVDRRNGPLDFREVRDRRFGPFVALTISGTL